MKRHVRSGLPAAQKAELLRRWDQVLGLDLGGGAPEGDLPAGAAAVLEARDKARGAKDFKTSDRLRDELAAIGVTVTDTPTGQRWKFARKKETQRRE